MIVGQMDVKGIDVAVSFGGGEDSRWRTLEGTKVSEMLLRYLGFEGITGRWWDWAVIVCRGGRRFFAPKFAVLEDGDRIEIWSQAAVEASRSNGKPIVA